MMYNASYGGMGLIWWFVWMMLLFWIFALPYRIPGQRYKKDSSLDILKKRFALGEITNAEFQEMKIILENDLIK